MGRLLGQTRSELLGRTENKQKCHISMLTRAYSCLHRQKSTHLVHLMLTTAFTSDEGSHHTGYRTSPQRQHVSGTTKMTFVISASHITLNKGKDSPDPAYTATWGTAPWRDPPKMPGHPFSLVEPKKENKVWGLRANPPGSGSVCRL